MLSNRYFEAFLAAVNRFLLFCQHHPLISSSIISLTILYIFYWLLSNRYPNNLPFVGELAGATRFSLRNRLRYYTDCASLYREAYENFSKKGKTVVVPGFGVRNEIILPPSSMRWLLDNPDPALSAGEAFADIDQVEYSLGHSKYVVDPWQSMLVKTKFNLTLDNIAVSLASELQYAFEMQFGIENESWKEVKLLHAMELAIAQAAARFIVGPSLCRDAEYLEASLALNKMMVVTAGVVGGCPKFLRPIIGLFTSFAVRWWLKRLKNIVKPLYEKEKCVLQQAKIKDLDKEPETHFQMMMRFAQTERVSEFNSLHTMVRRLTAANFGAMHQTSLQVTNMLLNIMASDGEYNTIFQLQDEARAVFGSDTSIKGPVWSKANIGKMLKADSVIRETLRMHPFNNRAIFRRVMADGIRTPDGILLPKGCTVSFLSFPVHMDEAAYNNPTRFDPFRFSRVREAALKDGKARSDLSLVATSCTHLPFGHGRHACPGRFLIDLELKMIIFYLFSRYEIRFPDKYRGCRPKNTWITEVLVPPAEAILLMKRRI